MCAPPGRAEAGAPTVAKVIAAAVREPPALCAHVWKTLNAILCCRTPVLGSHAYRCADCGRDHVVPHSCRNRHCPRCQGASAHAWLDRQEEDLLPVPYFHVVFTLPHSLNALIAQNPRAMHNLLFEAVSATLMEFTRNKLAVRPGITAVLHTWGQNLLDHHHLHCIVTGGGLSADGRSWRGLKANYLFAVRALSLVFRGKYRDGLQALYDQGKLEFHGKMAVHGSRAAFTRLVREACRPKWNVYAKRPFGGPAQVLAYLSRYTHRIAIGDRRIVKIDEDARTVTFAYKDYADHNQRKIMTLSLHEFLRRFCLHILPCGFVKIRHYGLLANRGRHQRVAQARQLITPEDDPPQDDAIVAEPTEPAAARPACPHCGSLRLLLVAVILPSRSRPRCDSS